MDKWQFNDMVVRDWVIIKIEANISRDTSYICSIDALFYVLKYLLTCRRKSINAPVHSLFDIQSLYNQEKQRKLLLLFSFKRCTNCYKELCPLRVNKTRFLKHCRK